jgi:hypothetical protein
MTVTAPRSVRPGQSISVKVTVRNTSASDLVAFQLVTLDLYQSGNGDAPFDFATVTSYSPNATTNPANGTEWYLRTPLPSQASLTYTLGVRVPAHISPSYGQWCWTGYYGESDPYSTAAWSSQAKAQACATINR